MSTPFQVCVDCADPHLLARFWAAALGYEVEDNTALIERVLGSGLATEDDTVTIDGQRFWKTAAACTDASGDGRPRLLFQVVPETKSGKNRVHVDLHVGAERQATEVERLTALGATRIGEGRQGPQTWVVMADPEGNEFCVLRSLAPS